MAPRDSVSTSRIGACGDINLDAASMELARHTPCELPVPVVESTWCSAWVSAVGNAHEDSTAAETFMWKTP